MDYNKVKELLAEYDADKVQRYTSYLHKLITQRKKDGALVNPWATAHNTKLTEEKCAEFYRRVLLEGLEFDGVHITIGARGIQYDYIAYKNKLLLVYPDAQIDFGLVKTGDEFSFVKENNKVVYTHIIKNPFSDAEIEGAYCVIRTPRGEFLSLLSKAELDKHRAIAQTQSIWRNWFNEMCYKTVIKKACRIHMDDIFTGMNETDKEQYNLDNPLSLDVDMRQAVDDAQTIEDLRRVYLRYKGSGAEFDQYIHAKKSLLLSQS